jgi:hypothetical protein
MMTLLALTLTGMMAILPGEEACLPNWCLTLLKVRE